MALAKIVYTSLTGNTQEIAEAFEKSLTAKGLDVEINPVDDVKASDYKDADAVVYLTYTFGQGELPDESVDFYEELKDVDLSGKPFVVIGSGDTSYGDLFCKSADDFATVLENIGAKKVAPVYKVEFNEFDQATLDDLADKLASAV